MTTSRFSRIATGKGGWPAKLGAKRQKVIALGLAAGARGVSLGRLQEALLKSAVLSKTAPSVGGKTSRGDTRHGLGYVDQWFTPSWIPRGCRIEKSLDYDYCVPCSRVRLVPTTKEASAKLRRARDTVERLCLC